MAVDREAQQAQRERELKERTDAAELVNALAKYAGQNRRHPERFIEALSHTHRTCQQEVTTLLVAWLTHLANAESKDYDGRNEASVALAKAMLFNDVEGRKNSPFYRNENDKWVFIGLPYL